MENTDTGAGSDTETGSSSTGSSSTGSGSTGSTGSTGSSEPTKDLAARRLDSLKGLGFFAGAFLSLVVLTVLLDRCRRYLNNAQATGLPEQNAVPAQAPRPDQIAEAEEPHGSQEQVGELSGDDPCPICQENLLHLDNGNPPVWKIVVQTSCTHAFHYDCIAPWRATHNTCPMCRSVGPFDTQEGPDGTERGPVLITRWLINNRLDDANDEKILHELKIDITAAELEAELEEKKGLTTPLLSGAEDMSPHLEQGEP